MKTVIVDFGGYAGTPGQIVQVYHTSPGGGRNAAKAVAEDGNDTGADIARILAHTINGGSSEFNPGQFQASFDDAKLHIMCSDDAGDVAIGASVDGGDEFPVTTL